MIRKVISRCLTLKALYVIYWKYFKINRKEFGYCAKNVSLTPPIMIGNPKNVFLYENTNIFPNSEISAIRAKFIMKKNSGAAEGLMVRTGNHKSEVGKWFKEIKDSDKEAEFDKDVVVEEDVWIGCNVTLLSGTKIGRGAVVGAGSVVRNSIPPYAVIAGNPCKVIGFRFTPEEIIKHEESLYPPSERFPFDILEKNYNKYFISRINEIRNFTRI